MNQNNRPTRGLVVLFILIRVVINGAYRMAYPYLKQFASGMGVTVQSASLALTTRSLAGGLGPLLAPLADRYGRRVGMLLGVGVFTFGVGIVAVWPAFPAFVAALTLANLGNMLFLPSMQAYLGDRIPYKRRGSILALTELSWSLSFMIVVPLLGLLIARMGWAAPFWVLTALGISMVVLLAWRTPPDRPSPSERPTALWSSLRAMLTQPAALVAVSFSLTISLANELVNLVFGVWMNDAFQGNIAVLGLAATVIGAAELTGEFATAALVDRIGKKRAVRIGLAATMLASLVLATIELTGLGRSQAGAMAGLFFFYLGFEFTLVSYIPLMTEVMPQARATLMSAYLASTSLGRAVGAVLGAVLYIAGFQANALAAFAFNLLALYLLSRVAVADD